MELIHLRHQGNPAAKKKRGQRDLVPEGGQTTGRKQESKRKARNLARGGDQTRPMTMQKNHWTKVLEAQKMPKIMVWGTL